MYTSPVAEKLNHINSTLPHLNETVYKLGSGFVEYILLFAYCVLMVYLCNRFLPTLTGGIKKIEIQYKRYA